MRIALTAALMVMAAIVWADEPNPPDAKTEAVPEAAQENAVEQATADEQGTEQATEEATAAAEAKADSKPFKVPAGYRSKRTNGKTVYCASSSVVGTRFGKEKCRTEAQLREIERHKEAATMQQNQAACSGAAVCAKN
jgi:hypothetical protein